MITHQLARSIARHLDVPDPSSLQSDSLFDVVNAINSGLQLFYSEAPAIYKRTTFSATLKAPQSIFLTFTAQYCNTLENAPFDPDWYGCGLTGTGMVPHNEIMGVAEVLDDWLEPTLTTQAQVLFDAQVLPITIERLTSDVLAYQVGSNINYVLTRDNQGHIDRRRHHQMPALHHRPGYYKIEPAALVRGFSTASILRIHPAPMVDTIIRFEAEVSAASIRAADLIHGAHVPIADAHIPLLTPLCEEALTYSPLWKDPKTKADIRTNAANVLANRIKKLPNDFGVPDSNVATPWGY